MSDSTASHPFDLSGKVALVTGASRGIGESIARTYAKAGAKVVLCSRKQPPLDEVAASIKSDGGEALAVAGHTGDSEAVAAVVKRAVETYGGIDIVVNNAATNPHFGPMMAADESHWDKTLDVNVKGYFRVAKACLETLKARGGGRLINIASIAGTTPQPGMGVYCVSKAAVIMLSKQLAVELAGDKITCNVIAPGFVQTRFSSAIWANEGINAKVLENIPLGRMAEPDEIAALALYLASDQSAFMTGSVLLCDGGQRVSPGIKI